MNKAKKVIILDKIQSPAILQAIFILRDEDENEFFALAEAERLVNDYLSNRPVSKRKPPFPFIIAALLSLTVAFICLYINF